MIAVNAFTIKRSRTYPRSTYRCSARDEAIGVPCFDKCEQEAKNIIKNNQLTTSTGSRKMPSYVKSLSLHWNRIRWSGLKPLIAKGLNAVAEHRHERQGSYWAAKPVRAIHGKKSVNPVQKINTDLRSLSRNVVIEGTESRRQSSSETMKESSLQTVTD